MKFKREHFCCSPRLLREIEEIQEVEAAIGEIVWTDHFAVEVKGRTYEHQSGYNRALAAGLHKFGWTMQPKLCTVPRLIGDASKNDVFVEIQFGNSATLYRDYYKFRPAASTPGRWAESTASASEIHPLKIQKSPNFTMV